jgi:hypothetical protein
MSRVRQYLERVVVVNKIGFQCLIEMSLILEKGNLKLFLEFGCISGKKTSNARRG